MRSKKTSPALGRTRPARKGEGEKPGDGETQAVPLKKRQGVMEKRSNGELKSEAGRKPKKPAVLAVAVWEGEVDPEALNAEVLRIIRQEDARRQWGDTEVARRCNMTRQNVHNLHHEHPYPNLLTLVKWCNGHQVALPFLLGYAADRLRRRHERLLAAAATLAPDGRNRGCVVPFVRSGRLGP